MARRSAQVDLFTLIAERRVSDLERLKPVAKSGRAGAVAAQQAMRMLRHEQLQEDIREG